MDVSYDHVAVDAQPAHVRACYAVILKRLLEQYPAAEGWSPCAAIETDKYELSFERGREGFSVVLASPVWLPAVNLATTSSDFVGCGIMLGAMAVGGLGVPVAARGYDPATAGFLGQLTLLGLMLGFMAGWVAKSLVLAWLKGKNPFPAWRLSAVRAEVAAVLNGPTPEMPDLIAELSGRLDAAGARLSGTTTAAEAKTTLAEIVDLSLLGRFIAPLYGDERKAEVAAFAEKRDAARKIAAERGA